MPVCANCLKDIPEDVFILHEAHCTRFLVLCAHCKISIPKSQKEAHDKENHKKEKCPYCSDLLDKKELALHKSICDNRPKPCMYCGAIMDLSLLFDHEDHCGSRTEQCDICGNNIVMKDFPQHLESCINGEAEPAENPSLKRKKNHNNSLKKRGKK